MSRITEIHVGAYRGLRDLTLEGVEEINVLIGPSNTGKTSLLEAVWLATSAQNMSGALGSVLSSRGIAGAASLNSLFPNEDIAVPIEIQLRLLRGEGSEKLSLSVQRPEVRNKNYTQLLFEKGLQPDEFKVLKVGCTLTNDQGENSFEYQIGVRQSDGLVDAGFISSGKMADLGHKSSFFFPAELPSIAIFDDAISSAYREGVLPELLDALREVYPDLHDIRSAKVGELWITYVQLSHATLPILAMGDGFKAAVVLLSYSLGEGFLLLDTPEAFQHTRGLKAISKALASAGAQLGTQVILATQSLEFLDMLLDECDRKGVGLSVYRFGFSEDRVVAHRPLSLQKAKESRELIGADLRG